MKIYRSRLLHRMKEFTAIPFLQYFCLSVMSPPPSRLDRASLTSDNCDTLPGINSLCHSRFQLQRGVSASAKTPMDDRRDENDESNRGGMQESKRDQVCFI